MDGTAEEAEDLDSRERELLALRRENQALGRAIVLLHEISNLVRAAQELEPTCYALLTGVTAGVGLGMNRAAIFLADDAGALRGMAAVGPMDREEADRVWRSIEADGPDLEALYEAGIVEHARPGRFDRMIRALAVDPRGQSPMAIAMRRGRLAAPGEGTDDLGGLLHLPTTLAAPLRGRSRIRGVLVADRRFTEEVPDAPTRLVFDLLADHAGRAVENAEHYESLAREARTDPLTGLGSRRSFDVRLSDLVGAIIADGGSAGLLMLDLDDFKRVNDTHGHVVGDHVLAEVGRRLTTTLRAGEGYRYGGEELAILLSGVSSEALAGAAERIHQTMTARTIEIPGGPAVRIGVSIGGALLPGHAQDAPGLLRAADDALLRAKADGKNRIRMA